MPEGISAGTIYVDVEARYNRESKRRVVNEIANDFAEPVVTGGGGGGTTPTGNVKVSKLPAELQPATFALNRAKARLGSGLSGELDYVKGFVAQAVEHGTLEPIQRGMTAQYNIESSIGNQIQAAHSAAASRIAQQQSKDDRDFQRFLKEERGEKIRANAMSHAARYGATNFGDGYQGTWSDISNDRIRAAVTTQGRATYDRNAKLQADFEENNARLQRAHSRGQLGAPAQPAGPVGPVGTGGGGGPGGGGPGGGGQGGGRGFLGGASRILGLDRPGTARMLAFQTMFGGWEIFGALQALRQADLQSIGASPERQMDIRNNLVNKLSSGMLGGFAAGAIDAVTNKYTELEEANRGARRGLAGVSIGESRIQGRYEAEGLVAMDGTRGHARQLAKIAMDERMSLRSSWSRIQENADLDADQKSRLYGIESASISNNAEFSRRSIMWEQRDVAARISSQSAAYSLIGSGNGFAATMAGFSSERYIASTQEADGPVLMAKLRDIDAREQMVTALATRSNATAASAAGSSAKALSAIMGGRPLEASLITLFSQRESVLKGIDRSSPGGNELYAAESNRFDKMAQYERWKFNESKERIFEDQSDRLHQLGLVAAGHPEAARAAGITSSALRSYQELTRSGMGDIADRELSAGVIALKGFKRQYLDSFGPEAVGLGRTDLTNTSAGSQSVTKLLEMINRGIQELNGKIGIR